MQITSVTNLSYQPAGGVESFAKVKQLFQDLGTALESGKISDAKDAMAQIQKNAPAQAGNRNNPMSSKIETLSKALDSGDLKAAQAAYADIKNAMSQRAPAGASRAGGPGGTPPNGATRSSGASESSSSTKVYDKKDTNKDGTVSAQEELAYDLTHSGDATDTSSTTGTNGNRGSFDAKA
jgi:hypothetical protein